MTTTIYQLSHIYMVNHINIFVIMLTCWHYDINQPKRNFHLLVIREAVVHACTDRLVLLYFVQPSS